MMNEGFCTECSMTAVELTKKLIQIESTDPGTYEGGIGAWITGWISQLPGVRYSREVVLPGRYNLMAELQGEEKEAPAMVFICHMDTVVTGTGWSVPPFEALEKDGRIYGRGACDMKAGLACCLSAFAHAARCRAEGTGPLKRTLKLICTVDEEDFMRGAEACIRSGWVTDKDWILDTEPTNGQIQVAHKGRTWYEIEVKGHTAHASTPWKGADAIAAMAEIIGSLRRSIQNAPEHPDLGKSTVTFGQITGGYRPYVVPGITASYKVTGNRPYVEKNPRSPLLAALRKICTQVTKEEPEVCVFPGYTDTAVIAGRLHNPNCMSYGPGNLECAHQPDEWVETADILRCESICKKLTEI